MSNITILHLSDIHFRWKKDEADKTLRKDVRSKMIDTIKAHMAENKIHPDFVVVTGDIAFSGKGKEYDEAKGFFNHLKSILPGETLFLVVPGNHDVDRGEISEYFSLHSIVQAKKTNGFLENEKERKNLINPKFKAFRAFVHELNPDLYRSEGDYFWVNDFKDKHVSFLGLNTCWASENNEDRNHITLGYPQVMNALERSKISNRVLLMHHPFNWLNEEDFNRYCREIFNRCGLVLHGHTHSDKALVLRSPADSCICLGANASYTDDKDGFIGFQFVHVSFRHEGVAVRVWPYRLDERNWKRFVPDTHRYKGQDGPCFELESFERSKIEKTTPLPPREIPEAYKEWVRQFHSTMDIDLLARKGEVITVNLPEVYIPIETRNPFYKEEQEEKRKTKGEKFLLEDIEVEEEQEGKKPPSIDIEALVGQKKRILLRGGAGTGKTTLIKHLAYTITHGTCLSALNHHLPIMVFLKELWPIYEEELKQGRKNIAFEQLLKLYLEKSKCKLTWDTVTVYLSFQQALFLIDGLDEVPEYLRSDLVDMMAQFQFDHKENRFLLTGRPHGITGRASVRFGDDLSDIHPLNNKMVEDFINKWFRAVSGQAVGLGEVTAGGMVSDIRQHEHISVFTQNPLLLTAVCILYQDGKRIPDQRADLYNRIVDNLISRRFHDPAHQGKENEILEFLMSLAFDAQVKNRKTIEVGEALEILKKTFPPEEDERESRYKQRMRDLFNEIEPNCGLLDSLSSGDIEFTHLTFQEFLAAKHMIYEGIVWNQFLAKESWEETLLLYVGIMSIDRKRDSNDIVETILKAGAEDGMSSHRLQLLGARALCDLQPSKRVSQKVSLARDKMFRLIESDAKLDHRFQAGVLLGSLGDTRISPDNMVLVPAGEFIRGSNKTSKIEKPERRIYLDGYMIGIYPITNNEFKSFIHDDGYHKKEFWTPEGLQWRDKEEIYEPSFWNDRQWNGPNFPVVGISWYEAAAYANWLSKKTGMLYRLPTEAQWEKAARGTDGREYPWGNKFDKNLCNSYECGLHRTSPVGIFPEGKSSYDCFDMAGNVWEWCADWYGSDYYKNSPHKNPIGPKSGTDRVLRGGGCRDVAENVRCADRVVSVPSYRSVSAGFRLCRDIH